VDQDGGSDLVDIVEVSQDGSEIFDASRVVVSVNLWVPIGSDRFGQLRRIQVRPIQHCSSWRFSRISFEMMASQFRIRIGEVYVTDWVSSNVIHGLQDQARRQTFARAVRFPFLTLSFFPSLPPFPPFRFPFVSSLCLPFPALLAPVIHLRSLGSAVSSPVGSEAKLRPATNAFLRISRSTIASSGDNFAYFYAKQMMKFCHLGDDKDRPKPLMDWVGWALVIHRSAKCSMPSMLSHS